MKIKELCADERPREKMLARGAGALSNAELLAILVGSGTRNANALEVANRLLSKADGRLSAIAAALEIGKRCCLEDPGIDKVPVTAPGMVYSLMLPRLRGLAHEEFWVVFLNRANYVIHKEMISLGGMSGTVVDPKLVLKKALDRHASGIIMVHNHPSGNPRPGREDIVQTGLMKEAAGTFDISLVDHVIVCDDRYFSFSDDRVYIPGEDG